MRKELVDGLALDFTNKCTVNKMNGWSTCFKFWFGKANNLYAHLNTMSYCMRFILVALMQWQWQWREQSRRIEVGYCFFFSFFPSPNRTIACNWSMISFHSLNGAFVVHSLGLFRSLPRHRLSHTSSPPPPKLPFWMFVVHTVFYMLK